MKTKPFVERGYWIDVEPWLVQGEVDLDCAVCGRRLALLAVFGDQTLGPTGFAGEDFVQVLFQLCATCGALGARQVCD